MKNDDLEIITNRIMEKIGNENSALIVDDLTEILTKNTEVYNDMQNKNTQIQKLKEDKERLIETNGNLFKQIPIAHEEKKPEETKPEESFSFYKMFDEKGNFIK